ncbi:CHAT domain-containing protein [Frankia sp. Mgl5]|uniref:CHAT domain-containing protein n=1 Tax=Frankia sp. Mgl5 TaxID=2933793 RepID=UPI0020107F60|nr:CHAT domain-containing protein [Frankia sp. Mgl5]MCK9925944.1 CHAT domain-containing protein [Frankia sp. Mgl5]
MNEAAGGPAGSPAGEAVDDAAHQLVERGTELFDRYRRGGPDVEPASVLDSAISLLTEALRLLPAEDDCRPSVSARLATGLMLRYSRHHSGPADRDTAIRLLEEVVALVDVDPGELAVARLQLAGLLLFRVFPEDHLAFFRETSSAMIAGGAFGPDFLRDARALDIQPAGVAARDDVERAIQHLQTLESTGAVPEHLRGAAQSLLGGARVVRGMILLSGAGLWTEGDAAPAARAARSGEPPALGMSPDRRPEAAPEQPAASAESLEDFGELIGSAAGLLADAPAFAGKEKYIDLLNGLGVVLSKKSRLPADPSELGGLIDGLDRLAELFPVDESSAEPALEILGRIRTRRSQMTGSIDDIDASRELFSRRLAGMDEDDPDRAVALRQLFGATVSAAASHMDPSLVREANDLARQVLASWNDQPPQPGSAAAEDLAKDRYLAGVAGMLAAITEQSDPASAERERLAAQGLLEQAYADLPTGNDLRVSLVGTIGAFLSERGHQYGVYDDVLTARDFLGQARSIIESSRETGLGVDDLDESMVEAVSAYVQLQNALHREKAAGQDRTAYIAAIEQAALALREAMDRVPRGFILAPTLRLGLGLAILSLGQAQADAARIREGLVLMEAAADDGADEQAPGPPALRRQIVMGAALAALAHAALDQDLAALDAAIERIRVLLAGGAPLRLQQARLHVGLGLAYGLRHELSGDPADLDQNVAALLDSVGAGAGDPGIARAAETQWALYRALRQRGRAEDHGRGVRAGLAALRTGVADVLLQHDVADRLAVAKQAAARAIEVSRWLLHECARCRRDADAAATAWAALELGRGLVLHAATATATAAELLDAAGHADIAAQWRAAPPLPVARPVDPDTGAAGIDLATVLLEMPSDLRLRALDALRQAPAGSPLETLLEAPALDDVRGALRTVGAEAMIYLLPGAEDSPGYALVLAVDGDRAAGDWVTVDLPGLTDRAGGELDRYVTAHSAYLEAAPPGSAEPPGTADLPGSAALPWPAVPGGLDDRRQAWRSALGPLCDWAGEVAMGPLLDWLSARRPQDAADPPRLVLVPCGRLGAVPWHAARSAAAGGRLAVQDAVISYAASARQFVETSGRVLPPPGARPVVVVPDASLSFARVLARNLVGKVYPDGRLYGPALSGAPGRGTPGEILEHMPGGAMPASLLQLGAHATVEKDDPLASYVRLAAPASLEAEPPPSGGNLTVGEILSQADRVLPARRTGTTAADAAGPAGLVVLFSCASDASDSDHDEALALSTALLAAGWAAVIAARWKVLDLRTSIMMFMFHRHLGDLARTRGAILPAEALRQTQLWMLDGNRVVPDDMPPLLAGPAREARLGGRRQDLELDDVCSWAAFTAQGR